MRAALDTAADAAETSPTSRRQTLVDYYQLTKPGITRLVLLTTAVGFYLASSAVDVWLLVHTLLGTGLVASGAGALNQLVEREPDTLMQRTRQRPLPAGRVSPVAAAWFGWSLGVAGLAYLLVFVNVTTVVVVAASLLSYVYLYTPLKRRTSLSTIVGTVPGALPIVAGWTAAGAPLDLRAATLFAIVALWQIPHFLALAWLYREDYGRAGMVMLSSDDDDGRYTSAQIVNYTVALLAASLLPTFLGIAGKIYFAGAFIVGATFVLLGVRMATRCTEQRARQLFLGSVIYLPVLLVLLAVDKLPG